VEEAVRIQPWHAAVLLIPAGIAAALLAAVRPPDPAPARAKRILAGRLLSTLERQVSELAEEERKFEAEILRVEDGYRRLAVERAARENDLEKALDAKYSKTEVFHLTMAWKADLTTEILAMEGEIEALEGDRDAVSAELDVLLREQGSAPPGSAEAIDAKRNDLAGRKEVLRGAREDLARARKVLTNR
jgi:hypothetical protein